MGSVRLHPKDRAKYGAPEEIPFNLSEIGVKQRSAFEKQTKRPLKWFYDQLSGVPELDENGNAVPELVFNRDGSPKLNDDGSQAVRVKLTRDPEVFAMLAWLALWGDGIKVPYDTFEVIEIGLHIDLSSDDDDDDEVDEGKAPTDSENMTSPTTETSPTG